MFDSYLFKFVEVLDNQVKIRNRCSIYIALLINRRNRRFKDPDGVIRIINQLIKHLSGCLDYNFGVKLKFEVVIIFLVD